MISDSGKKHSKHGLSKEMARKQMIALNISLAREHGHPIPKLPASKEYKSRPASKSTGKLKTAEEIEHDVKVKEAARLELDKKLAPTMKDHLDVLKKERAELKTAMVSLHPEAVEHEKPKLKEVSLKTVAIAPKVSARHEDYAKMSQAQRKDLYEEYHKKGVSAEDIPKEARKGYKIWMKRNV